MDALEVLVVGSLNADVTIPVDRLPVVGETVLGGDVTVGPGGKGGNQAVAAARLGAAVAMIAAVGDDGDGRFMAESLTAGGVEISSVVVVDRPTGRAVIALVPDGDNAIIVSPGANAGLSTTHVADAKAAVANAHVVLAQLEVPADTVAAAFAATAGRTVLNPAPADPSTGDLLAECSILVPNQTELALLTGSEPPRTAGAAAEQAARLVGPERSVVVTLGSEGAVVVTAGADPVLVPPVATRVVDTTGAGDAFCGALAAALSRGMELVAATRVGVAAGAIAVGHPGALPPNALAALADQLPPRS